MRSTLEIIIAVKESKPATEDELRLALLVMSNMEHLVRRELEALAAAVEQDKPSAKLRVGFARKTLETMFYARKKDPLEWLGPENTPGNPEYERRYAMAIKLLEKVEQQAK
jgi:hypothetical protein